MSNATKRQSKQRPSKPDGLPIERDSTFVRVTADEAVVFNKGGELHLALLALGPDPVFQGKAVEDLRPIPMQPVHMTASIYEVARVRMPGGEAFSMAMQIVENALAAGRVRTAAFRTAIEAMLSEYEHLDDDADESNDETAK